VRRLYMAEYEIVVYLRAPADVDGEALEGHVRDVLGERYTEQVALAPVVAVDLGKRHIGLGFCVEGDSPERANAQVGKVLRTIERNTDGQFTPTAAASSVAVSPDGCALAAFA
jgi:hypothetical protein